jgi:hypothetical protein
MGKRRAEGQEQAANPSPAQGAAQPAPVAGAGMSADAVQRLQELAELHKQGVLTDEEFAAQKALILS